MYSQGTSDKEDDKSQIEGSSN